MCGRMTLTRSGNEIAEYYAEALARDAIEFADSRDVRPRYNIAPSQELLTLAPDEERAFALEWRVWGLLPSWAKDSKISARLFNARSETASSKPSFRTAWKRRRCLIPASGFYEWKPRNKGHDPHYFQSTDENLLTFAGLFESWLGEGGQVVDSCTILTTDASPDLEGIHHRMPVLLDRENFARWLDLETTAEDLAELCAPAPAGRLKNHIVTRLVNNARRDEPACLDPEVSEKQDDLFREAE